MKRKVGLLCALVFALTVLAFFAMNGDSAHASSASAIIAETFESLNITDATYEGVKQRTEGGKDYKYYFSERENTEFYFDTVTGRLEIVINWKASEAREEYKKNGIASPMTATERRNAVLEYVSCLFAPNSIGDWQITRENEATVDCTYVVEEYYNDIPTGSNALLVCTYNAEVTMCTLTYGSVLQNTGKGTATYSSRNTQISEEDALSIAEEYIRFAAQEDGNTYVGDLISCELKANGDLLYYSVELTAMENDYEIIYLVTVDVYTGEIIECARSV